MLVSHTDKIPKAPRGHRKGIARGTRGSKYMQQKEQPTWAARRAAFEKREAYLAQVGGMYPERLKQE